MVYDNTLLTAPALTGGRYLEPNGLLVAQALVTGTPDPALADTGEGGLDHHIGSVVVDSAKKPLEILTGTDFADGVSNDLATAGATVEESMTESVVGAEDTVRDAAATMIADNSEPLPVEDGAVDGTLSTTDLTARLAYLES